MLKSVPEGESVSAAIAVLVMQNNQLLLGKRVQPSEPECWQCPGGFILKGETLTTAADRICRQKAGIKIDALVQGPFTNNRFVQNNIISQHTVSLYLIAHKYKVVDNIKYENKQTCWSWHDFDSLPVPLFMPLETLLKKYDLNHLLMY